MPAPRPPLLERIADALAVRAPQRAERDEPFKEAAVALVLRTHRVSDDLELLLIRRATREGDPWSGQIALPGGGWESHDSSLEATAIRETVEEVGLDLAARGRMLGVLDELRPRTPVLPPVIVRPHVFALAGAADDVALQLVLSEEVAEVRWVALGRLFAPETRVETSIEVRDLRLRVDALRVDDFIIWGMTERILQGLEAIVRD